MQLFSSPSDLMKSTVVDEACLQMQPEFCSRGKTTLLIQPSFICEDFSFCCLKFIKDDFSHNRTFDWTQTSFHQHQLTSSGLRFIRFSDLMKSTDVDESLSVQSNVLLWEKSSFINPHLGILPYTPLLPLPFALPRWNLILIKKHPFPWPSHKKKVQPSLVFKSTSSLFNRLSLVFKSMS